MSKPKIVRLMAEEIFDINGNSCPAEYYGCCPKSKDDLESPPFEDCGEEDAISCWIKYFERQAKEAQ